MHVFGARFFSILAAAFLVFAAAAPPASAQSGSPAITAGTITPARIQEIIDRVSGADLASIGPIVMNTLGLGLNARGQPVPVYQGGFEIDGRVHRFNILPGDPDRYVVFVQEGRTMDLWVIDGRGTLINAGRIANGGINVVPLDQARASYDAEMQLWATTDNIALVMVR